ncbi:hypothetical protein [Bradyrhizobium sp. LTSP849]|uniref:hypothetical protein n=1 Tax=Bradyrhizobium sp. LTSP849 TaxID=1615890 RepID=UPI000A887122|nr:hypothetical protein [Bradyrhizobium sp. LTSP849]
MMAGERRTFAGQLWPLAGARTASTVLSTVALVDFYAQNADKLDGPTRVIRYASILC